MTKENPLIGKTVVAVHLADDKKAIKFEVEGGDSIIARADGDCCSSTWIESLDAPQALIGRVIAVEYLDMPQLPQTDEFEVVAYYGLKITTEKGSCVLDYRNESNGYYGGNLAWPEEYFYGGVYGQNVSTEQWEKIA